VKNFTVHVYSCNSVPPQRRARVEFVSQRPTRSTAVCIRYLQRHRKSSGNIDWCHCVPRWVNRQIAYAADSSLSTFISLIRIPLNANSL